MLCAFVTCSIKLLLLLLLQNTYMQYRRPIMFVIINTKRNNLTILADRTIVANLL